MVTLDLSKSYVYSDCLNWLGEVSCELIDGFIKMFPSPIRTHAGVASDLTFLFKDAVKKNKGNCRVYTAPFDVVFLSDGETDIKQAKNVVQPDLLVVCNKEKLKNVCVGAPDLIVEVLSPSTADRDWRVKFDLYEKHGVREYWVVSPTDLSIKVFLLQDDGKYDEGTFYEKEGNIPIFIFDGYRLSLKDIFEEMSF